MEWGLHKIGESKIVSDTGYVISFCVDDSGGLTAFASWPPVDEGVLEIQGGQKVKYKKAIGYFCSLAESKYSCDAHYALSLGLDPLPPYEPEPVVSDMASIDSNYSYLDEGDGSFSPPPAPEGYKAEKVDFKRRSDCKTVEDLVRYCGMNEGQAQHIIDGRQEKKKLVDRALKASAYLTHHGFEGYQYDFKSLFSLKPKQLNEIIDKANSFRENKGGDNV